MLCHVVIFLSFLCQEKDHLSGIYLRLSNVNMLERIHVVYSKQCSETRMKWRDAPAQILMADLSSASGHR